MKKIRGLCLPVMLGAVLMSQHVHAADNLTFKGKLIIPACTVSNTTVDWQDVEIQTLSPDGSGHQKDFSVGMNCPYSLGTMKVTITSNGQTGNSILVPDTSTASGGGLLVYLYNSNAGNIGTAITLGTPFTPGKITGTAPARKITLYAKLGYKGDMRKLQAKAFSATATLVASYS
ncbi:fimbrial protein [Escherichia coli]|jgi:minor pilin subunit PapE|uniref:fimbrial protein n=1 Tax=Escherichia coli TaxID=562 RepID=UPI000391125A|nr:fimbrial protein [Escherichia coli]EFN2059882.1 fimbrial protein [Escherichia coli]EJM9776882.1 fimbrial protein [Escherichia coli]EKW0000578.1 fimbrial protein [Escherichia coli]ELK7342879.1 fimbrial protein [Escherichia coli]ERB03803.1 fimbrial protein papE [Escherichia coli KOEGE 10 (25a)]